MRSADLDELTLHIEVEPELAQKGGQFIARVPINTLCPACGGQPLERLRCGLCEGGIMEMSVRATIELPRGLTFGERVKLQCFLELFGARRLWAVVEPLP